MKLLVGSVFSNSPRNPTWHKLQMEFLKETTVDFDHFVIITQDTDYNIFESRILKVFPAGWYKKLVIHGKPERFTAHLDGCNEFLQYFYSHPEYNHLLILDSDCFPFRKGWQKLLIEKMKNHEFAAAIRAENLDTFPHPCVLFLRKRDTYLRSFTPDKWTINLIGQKFADTGATLDQRWCYPLMRSNVYNPHPIFAGAYHDMFYHHGCGSRQAKTRAIDCGYFDHQITNHEEIEETLYEQLKNNPKEFINHITGKLALYPSQAKD